MNIWIDVLTPKHLLFFLPLKKELEKFNHHVLLTTRNHPEVPELLKQKGEKGLVIGEYGHSLKEKLVASAKRIIALADLVESEGIELAFSFSSPEAARVAFGLGIPHVTANNSPHAVHSAKLTIPLSDLLFTPFVYSKSVWTAFGISGDRIVQYRALDEAMWLKRFSPDPSVLGRLGLSKGEEYVLVREIESSASYIISKYGRGFMISKKVVPVIRSACPECSIVVSTRYPYQAEEVRKLFGGDVIVQDRPMDTTSLIYFSKLFVGGGGTMTKEAVLLGVPAISVFPFRLTEIEYLQSRGALIYCQTVQELERAVRRCLTDGRLRDGLSSAGRALLEEFEDPLEVIVENVKRMYGI